MTLFPKTKLVPTQAEREPALESAVPGVSIYRACRSDARFLHKLLPIAQRLASRVAAVKQGDPEASELLKDYNALLQGRA